MLPMRHEDKCEKNLQEEKQYHFFSLWSNTSFLLACNKHGFLVFLPSYLHVLASLIMECPLENPPKTSEKFLNIWLLPNWVVIYSSISIFHYLSDPWWEIALFTIETTVPSKMSPWFMYKTTLCFNISLVTSGQGE